MKDLAAARAPAAPLGAALYESHYLTAVDPAGGRAVWLRHTSLKRPGSAARPTLWLTLFDRGAPAPRALRVTAAGPALPPGRAWTRSEFGSFGADQASGAVPAGEGGDRRGIGSARWELAWDGADPELPYLPARWLYDRALPRSGGVALRPSVTVDGSVEADGIGALELAGWEGMVGHNWGTEHAEQWSWLHASGLGEDRRGWLDVVLARVRIGPVLAPWIASGAVCLGGRRQRAAGRVSRRVSGEESSVGLALSAGGRLELAIHAPAAATAHWDYASPRGVGREVSHCTVADASVTITNRGSRQEFPVAGRFAVEHGAPARA